MIFHHQLKIKGSNVLDYIPPSPRRSSDFIETKAGFIIIIRLGYGETLSAFIDIFVAYNPLTSFLLSFTVVLMYYVYILRCADSKPYIGCTDNLKERIERHNKEYVPAMKPLLPITLMSYFAFSNKYTAFNFEKYLKSDSGRAFTKKHFF